jgi:hypothetical protein
VVARLLKWLVIVRVVLVARLQAVVMDRVRFIRNRFSTIKTPNLTATTTRMTL